MSPEEKKKWFNDNLALLNTIENVELSGYETEDNYQLDRDNSTEIVEALLEALNDGRFDEILAKMGYYKCEKAMIELEGTIVGTRVNFVFDDDKGFGLDEGDEILTVKVS